MRELQGTGEGMAEANHPIDKVRALQRALYVAAKQQRQRRFHALYDRIARPDVLRRAWEQVRRNKGAAGIDGETMQAIEAFGVEKMLTELYLTALSRPPQPAEVKDALEYVGKAPDKRKAWEDVLWALLNTREFLFRH